MLPRVVLVTISVADLQPMQMTMSSEVEASLPRVEAMAAELVARLTEGPAPTLS